MKHFGEVIGVDREQIDEYERVHDAIYPEVREALQSAGIQNFNIFVDRDLGLLFAYYEYDGPDDEFDVRMADVAEISRSSGWWPLTGAMQRPLDTREPGQWWKPMRRVFHMP